MTSILISSVYVLSYCIVLGVCLAACWTDFKSFRIPNKLCLIALIASVCGIGAAFAYGAAAGHDLPIISHLISGVVVFVVTAVLFVSRLFGAGDAKLLSILAFWIPIKFLSVFLFMMSLIGGGIAIATLIMRRWKPFSAPLPGSWIDTAQKGEGRVPYGLAIGAGFIIATLFWGMWDPLRFINL
jgi:prepilin peptidase CpaA